MTFTFFHIIGNYEVLPTEPLHDIKEHIANVLTELPSHLENEEKNAFQDIIECSLGGKEKLRGCDYRLAAVIVAQYLRGNENKIIIIMTIIIQWNLNIMKGYWDWQNLCAIWRFVILTFHCSN